MGNSGSMHNLATAVDEHLNNQHHQHQHAPQSWQSYQRPTPVKQQFKVLPEVLPSSRILRSTNNGAILHSGGTLTNKKDNTGVQRSKSISSTHHYGPSNPYQMQRSRTQLNMLEEREERMLNYKRFGSEPDLRGSGEENKTQQVQQQLPKGRAKLLRGKKKKAAPAPPPQSQHMMEHEYDPSRFGWKPKSQQVQQVQPIKEPPPRKLRLFKTKAESKKSASQVRLNTEASDLHFRKFSNDRRDQYPREPERPRESIRPYNGGNGFEHNHRKDDEIDRYSDSEWKQSRTQVIPMPQMMRREKTFDTSLLGGRPNSIETFLKSRRQRAPSPTGQQPRLQKYPEPERLQSSRNPPPEPKHLNIPLQKESAKVQLRKPTQPIKQNGVDFKQELLEATRRRKLSAVVQQKEREKTKEIPPVMRPVPRVRVCKKEIPTPKINEVKIKNTDPIRRISQNTEQSCVTKEEISPEKINIRNSINSTNVNVNNNIERLIPKTFYFGMDENAEPELVDEIIDRAQLDVIDRFAESLLKRKSVQRRTNESSESALSSDIEDIIMDGQNHDIVTADGESEGISLQLRPTLPKKQFEIPRFSPAAAWRLLSPGDDLKEPPQWYSSTEKLNVPSYSGKQQEGSNRSEDRIERIYREPIPGLSDNKSGDSGISGDAGLLPERAESPRFNSNPVTPMNNLNLPNSNIKVGPFLSAWTPQQDLGEESSSDGGELTSKNEISKYVVGKGHVFSLSLPRESHLVQYSEKEEKQSFNSLQKLKKTVSGAFGVSGSSQEKQENIRSDNWLLSRSAPNSIDNCQKSPISNSISDQDDELKRQSQPASSISIKPPSFNYLTSGKHMMYLPNHTVGESSDYKIDENEGRDFVDAKQEYDNEIIPTDERKAYKIELEDLQDPPEKIEYHKPNKTKGHRFTFQSTVRQIERRRIADKLSKEAEHKEAQRLSELEAMRRVEEEFQKKRAREKASIRQQLRIFSMEENHCNSLPVEWETNCTRAEPDGAVSSRTNSPSPPTNFRKHNEIQRQSSDDFIDTKTPYISRIVEEKSSKMIGNNRSLEQRTAPTTEVLSEFRTPRREYIEYRGGRRSQSPAVTTPIIQRKLPTEHPAFVCNIPSRGQTNYGYSDDFSSSDNYRRDFARGRSVGSSGESEISAPSSGLRHLQQRSRF